MKRDHNREKKHQSMTKNLDYSSESFRAVQSPNCDRMFSKGQTNSYLLPLGTIACARCQMNHNMLAEVSNLEYIVSSHINQYVKNKWQIHKLENKAGQNEIIIIQFCGLGMD